jgi:hypothetical protein
MPPAREISITPDPLPRNTEWHRRIVSTTRMKGYRNAHQLDLECGHYAFTFGDPANLEGKAHCEQCVKNAAKERNAPGS